MYRIGLGFDNHRLAPGRPLWVGGVRLEAEVGAVAHSDGDVLLHALTDAILGAVGAGDIGERFPDHDPRWKGHPSDRFVREAGRIALESGFGVVNLDATVFLERIELGPYKPRIAERIREILRAFGEVEPGCVNIKAKTMERCDAVGSGEAIAAQVAVLLESRS